LIEVFCISHLAALNALFTVYWADRNVLSLKERSKFSMDFESGAIAKTFAMNTNTRAVQWQGFFLQIFWLLNRLDWYASIAR
jgi:hypothetical protein